ncbi:MAG: 4-hydroxy-tetrahydrodipicolinate reductase [Deltaproteobacteria bacterium]|nr:4-hydroxy-tetrahydrodipicolinate reductase [Deltaproteobacteria bacterium]
MTKVCVVGALGRMGERVRAALGDEAGLELASALEAPGHPGVGDDAGGVAVVDDAKAALGAADVAIVFATPEPSLEVLRVAAEAGVRCVVGTTGFSSAQRAELETLAERVAIVLAPNFSVAVNVLGELVRRLGEGWDAELVEIHHAAKRDAPSGTALWLADAVAEGRGAEAPRVLAREGDTGPRQPGSIGIQTLRGGDNPGEHSVLFVGQGERLELTHRSATRDHFARGAVRAAAWVSGRAPGLYTMTDVLGLHP